MLPPRFGYKWDEFRTFNDALMTQFYILIGDSNPETKGSTLMAIYVVGFVFICTLALLNFLLAIVVNGCECLLPPSPRPRPSSAIPQPIVMQPQAMLLASQRVAATDALLRTSQTPLCARRCRR